MIVNNLFRIEVIERDYARSIEIAPVSEGFDDFGGFIEVGYPSGKGDWIFKRFRESEKVEGIPTLTFERRWAKELYNKLREIFDPKDSVSIDAIKMQETHLSDMRKIVGKQLDIELVNKNDRSISHRLVGKS